MPPERILVVDDKESVLGLLATILGSYQLTTASDGVKALALIRAEQFDAVVTDISMPGADGFEVLKTVKEVSPETPVVMITAYAAVPDAVSAMKLGAYDYIAKPFDPDDVALVVARAIEHRRRSLSEATARKAVTQDSDAAGEELVSQPFREAVESARDRVSREYLVALLRKLEGNVTRAAERAGMERVSLHRLLKRYGVRSEDFKKPSAPSTTSSGE
jgi:two-component system, NtrC family, response regulator HydG